MARQLVVGNQGRTHQVGAYQGSFRGRERIAYQDLPSIHEIEQTLEQLTASITLRTENDPSMQIRIWIVTICLLVPFICQVFCRYSKR
jgi:hypothetical protein